MIGSDDGPAFVLQILTGGLDPGSETSSQDSRASMEGPLRRPHDNSHGSQSRRGRRMDPLLSCPADGPARSSDNGAPRRNLEHPQTSIQPTETQIAQRWGPIPKPSQLALILLLLLFFFSFRQASAVSNPHQPDWWVLSRHGEGPQSQTGPLGGPAAASFVTTLCALAPLGCCLNAKDFSVCPASGPTY